jgi:tRNA(fMet)-specific endonuclease VapC
MPTNGSVVLDTNIAIAFLSDDRSVREHVAETERIILPAVVLGELFYGARHSDRVEDNLQRVEELALNCEVLDVSIETARQYGIIKSELRRKGTPIPNNDIWIAALTQQYDATVATRDQHFDAVEHLEVVRW